MIRYAIGTVLTFYFIGAQPIQPYVPPVLDDATSGFHKYVNRGLKKALRPALRFVGGGSSSS